MAVACPVNGLVTMATTDIEQGHTDWFAVQVRARWEESTAKLLSGKGYEILLPKYRSSRRWGGKNRAIEAPLFQGYVFCRFDVLKRLPVLVTPGVMSIVSRGRVPVPVEPAEIAAIRTLVHAGIEAEPHPYLAIGQKVRIDDTPLQGLEGILVAFKGSSHIVVSVTLLQRSVAVAIDRASVTPIEQTQPVSTSAPAAQECVIVS
jgi:transcription antitermination factor NusG